MMSSSTTINSHNHASRAPRRDRRAMNEQSSVELHNHNNHHRPSASNPSTSATGSVQYHHESFPEAGWVSFFIVPCWICPSTTTNKYTAAAFDNDDGGGNGGIDSGVGAVGMSTHASRHSPPPPPPTTLPETTDGISKMPPETSMKSQEEDEVLGWTLDAAARGVAVMGTAVFVSSDLLRLAKEATGCYMYEDNMWDANVADDDYNNMWEGGGGDWNQAEGAEEVTECRERVMGMRPSSILAAIVMVVGLLSALVMPLVGSIIDHTKYRRGVGSLSAAAMSVFILIQMLVMERNWFVAAILQIFVAFTYTVHLCAVYAYLPELTVDHEKLMDYTARFSASQYIGSVSFLLLMVCVLSVCNRDNQFRSSILSQSIVFAVCCIFFGYAWSRLFRTRPASQSVPEGRNLLSAGFWKIFSTTHIILKHHSAIKWFLVSAAFTEAATTTFSTIAITYMTEQLGFTSRENGMAILLLLLAGIPGTRVAAWLASLINPIRSLQCCLFFWIITITTASLSLHQPNQQVTAYIFAILWGLAIGWVYPTEKTLYVTIIPKGQEAELMGTYICACQMLSWLPPLVFSIINEAGYSMRIGLLSLTIYFSASIIALFFVGNYNEAVAHAKAIDDGAISFSMSKIEFADAIGHFYEDFADDNPELRQSKFSPSFDATPRIK